METIKYINISLEIFGCILSLFIIIFMKFGKSIKNELHHKFILILICNTIILMCDAAAWGFKGHTDALSRLIVPIANFCVFTFGYVILVLFTNYLLAFTSTKRPVSKKYQVLIWGIAAIAIALTVLSQWNGMYYTIDADNMYRRGDWFWLSQFWGILCMLIDLLILTHYRKSISRQEMTAFVSYILLPVLAMSIQVFLYGVALLYITTTVTVVVIYIGVQTEQAQLINDKELELAQNRISIMLSQIQPHFLYNSLTAIKHLCRTDPAMAEAAVMHFADYLRGNLDSLSTEKPILFEKELAHVETYLALEKMRFGEELRIVYDIRCEGFMLPVLTVQPLVENAVRYGVTKKEGGGTVTISTEETDSEIIITVADDGAGFDTAQEKNDGQTHIGIQNVRSRLAAQCGGKLMVESKAGVGTTATITLPKGGKENKDTCSG